LTLRISINVGGASRILSRYQLGGGSLGGQLSERGHGSARLTPREHKLDRDNEPAVEDGGVRQLEEVAQVVKRLVKEGHRSALTSAILEWVSIADVKITHPFVAL
jgi:hypothetical protein